MYYNPRAAHGELNDPTNYQGMTMVVDESVLPDRHLIIYCSRRSTPTEEELLNLMLVEGR
ncbi:MAG: hypothetical protein AB7Q00_14560 [Phycisphaerales bacterium]